MADKPAGKHPSSARDTSHRPANRTSSSGGGSKTHGTGSTDKAAKHTDKRASSDRSTDRPRSSGSKYGKGGDRRDRDQRPPRRRDERRDEHGKKSGRPESARGPRKGDRDRTAEKHGGKIRRTLRPRADLPRSSVVRRPPAWLTHFDKTPHINTPSVTEIVEALQLDLPGDRIAKLLDHLLLVRELNREVNLVSRANVDGVLLQSLWECLIPLLDLSWRSGDQILDLGSGGGFPGLPLAIAIPEASFTLIDSRRAKTLALKSMVNELGLKNVDVVHERAETFADHDERRFDTVTVRAVGMLKEVAPWSAPLLKDGGSMLAWKGPEGARELQSLPGDTWSLRTSLDVLPHRYVLVIGYSKTDSTEK